MINDICCNQKKDRRDNKLKCHPELVSGSYQFGVIGSIRLINKH